MRGDKGIRQESICYQDSVFLALLTRHEARKVYLG